MLGTSVFLKFEVQFTNAAIEVTTVRNRSEWILKARRNTPKTKREMQKTKRDSFFVFLSWLKLANTEDLVENGADARLLRVNPATWGKMTVSEVRSKSV